MDDYLAKPVEPERLRAALESYVDEARRSCAPEARETRGPSR